jgi:endonuclease III
MLLRRLRGLAPIDLRASLSPLVASAQDPTIRLRDHAVVRAMASPEGPATLEVRREGSSFLARAWGPGAVWALETAPGLLGAHDDRTGFDPGYHEVLARADRTNPYLRIVRSGLVSDLLVATILAQRVTAGEAARSWTRMVRRWGRLAPGPHGLRLPPTAQELAATPYWAFHELGVERSRAQTISRACRRLSRLQEAVDLPPPDALARLCAIPGLGPWTAALVLRVAAGHADAVEVGDYHVKNHIGWALAGEPRATDERMLELLSPFAGHRGRAVRLLLASAPRAPAFGPRKRVVPVHHL